MNTDNDMDDRPIEWTSALAIGNAVIDRQHRRLFELAADIVADHSHVRVMRTLAALSEYVIVHFRDEEKLLEEVGYPDLVAHKKLHDAFRTRLAKFYGDASGMALDRIAEEIRQMINEWLTRHIMVVDREYAKYVAASK